MDGGCSCNAFIYATKIIKHFKKKNNKSLVILIIKCFQTKKLDEDRAVEVFPEDCC